MMISVWSLLVLALAVSLDALSAGMVYGSRNIRIPAVSVAIVSLCSAIILFCSMSFGSLLVNFLPAMTAKWIGACILIGIGLWAIVQFKRSSAEATIRQAGGESRQEEEMLLQWELRPLGIIIRIWKTPSKADMDRSGTISAPEALLLGLALSIDSIGAGIGAALIGFPPVLTALLIGISCGGCILVGVKLGCWLAGWQWMRRLMVLPGIILVGMGIMKLM